MANYCCVIRTNYFHVKDEEAFRNLMSRVYGSEDNIKFWEAKDNNGKTVFCFGAYGGIAGLVDSDDEEADSSSYDDFIEALQKVVADDDAIIIMESGNEKMRYIVGSATIITSLQYEYIDIQSTAAKMAADLLNNPLWKTQCEY